MLLGVQVSAEGSVVNAIEEAAKLGCNVLQMFSRNPQTWRRDFLRPEIFAQFRAQRQLAKIEKVFVHIPYLINLASPDKKLYNASIDAYIEDIAEADALGADFIVTHMGSHRASGETQGLKRFSQALAIILRNSRTTKVGILLENTTGSGSWLGYNFSHHQKIIQMLNHDPRLGICIDTAHAFAAGYDLASAGGLEEMLAQIQKLLAIATVKLIHLNDTTSPLGSKYDRHAHIGRGLLGKEAIARIINHRLLRNIPFILETPKDSLQDDINNLNTVRMLRKK